MTTKAPPERAVILVVDDDKNTRDGLERALRRTYSVYTAESAQRALDLLSDRHVDVLLSDVRMPGMDGITLMQRAIARSPDLVCILLTAYGNVETAVQAMKSGARDFLMKPVNLDHLELLLDRSLHSRQVEAENARLKAQLDRRYGMESLVGHSPAMEDLFDTIRQAAPTQATVLITGETGTGKELVAHALHRLSPRAQAPFVAVHCAALAPNILESELFGHEKGAFTGAIARRRGRFELADGGTLFLDEISEIDASIQVKLLRVLEERTFERVGGNESVEVDIRLVAATNRDLREQVAAGKFREDLYFRLDVVNIHLPPLRGRADDITLLSQHFLSEFNAKHGKSIAALTPETCNVLAAYAWPGNVRELRNTIEKMVVLGRGETLAPRDVPRHIRETVRESGYRFPGATRRPPAVQPGDSLAEAERRLIEAALERSNHNVTQAARDLGISRRTLHRKIKQYSEQSAGGAGPSEPPFAGGDTVED